MNKKKSHCGDVINVQRLKLTMMIIYQEGVKRTYTKKSRETKELLIKQKMRNMKLQAKKKIYEVE